MAQWHFPLINPVVHYPLEHYLEHLLEEIEEFKDETDDEKKRQEALDVLHAAETLVRKYFERTSGDTFMQVKNRVIAKNLNRGYYTR